jgi:hypothetical protein
MPLIASISFWYHLLEFIAIYISLFPVFIFLVKPSKNGFTLKLLILCLALCSFEIDALSVVVIHLKQSNHKLVGIYNILSSIIYSLLIYQLTKGNKNAMLLTIVNLGIVTCLIGEGLISTERLITSNFYTIFSLLVLFECIMIYRHSLYSFLRSGSWNTPNFLITTGIFTNFSLTIVLSINMQFLINPNLPEIDSFNKILISQFLATITQYILFTFALWKMPT